VISPAGRAAAQAPAGETGMVVVDTTTREAI
jgi:hypothetical protein